MLSDLVLFHWDFGLVEPVTADILNVLDALCDFMLDRSQVSPHAVATLISLLSHKFELIVESFGY
jgi:hypothetical protein